MQWLIKYALFNAFAVTTALSALGFIVLTISTLCIASGGFIIHAIYNHEANIINQHKKIIINNTISESLANKLYVLFTSIGVGLGFYLSHSVGKPAFFIVFVAIAALLYIHASYLKQITLVGNIVISAIIATSIIVVGIFELIPAITIENQAVQSTMFEVLIDYAIFISLISFIRQLVTDILNTNGDYKLGTKTLPIVFGKNRTAKIAFGVTCITILLIAYYIATYVYMHTEVILYFLFLVIAPLIYSAIKLFLVEKNNEFKLINTVLKLVIITGFLSMILYYFII